jgi:hypothetical protein
MRTIFRAVGLVLELIAWYCVGLWVRSVNRKHKRIFDDLEP